MKKIALSKMIMLSGVAFEHFDMMLVSLLATTMIKAFIGEQSPQTLLLYAYVGYAIAFLFRPFGAFIFGCIGDLYGRKPALIGSMFLMAIATFAIAFIPSFNKLGMISTLLFFICRIAQGLAIGGEYGTAMTYACEINRNQQTFNGAVVISSTHIGGLCASVLASFFINDFRSVFLIGGLAGLLVLFLRSSMKENYAPTFKKMSELTISSEKKRQVILKSFLIASQLVLVFYGSFIYLNELLHSKFAISHKQLFIANSYLLALWILIPPLLGYLVDKYKLNFQRVMQFGSVGVFFSAPILALALISQKFTFIYAAQILLHIFHMIFCLCTPRFFYHLFKSHARNTYISTSYAISASLTAALTPLICHAMIQLFQNIAAISLPFMLITAFTFFILKPEKLCKPMMPLNSTI